MVKWPERKKWYGRRDKIMTWEQHRKQREDRFKEILGQELWDLLEKEILRQKMLEIMKEVADHFHIKDWTILRRPSRKLAVMKGRRKAVRRCRAETDATLCEIGKMFNRTHPSILYLLGAKNDES